MRKHALIALSGFSLALGLTAPAQGQTQWHYETLFDEVESGVLGGLFSPSMNASGQVAFVQRAGPGNRVLMLDAGNLRTVFDAAASPWRSVTANGLILADNGDVAIPVSDFNSDAALVLWDESLGSTRLVADSQTLTALLGTPVVLATWDMNESGQVAMRAQVPNGPVWLLRWTDGSFETLAYSDLGGPDPRWLIFTPVIDDDGSVIAPVESDGGARDLVRFPPSGPEQVLGLLPGEAPFDVKNVLGGRLVYYGVVGGNGFLRMREASGSITTLARFGCGQEFVATPGRSQVTVSQNAAGQYAFYAGLGDCAPLSIGIFAGPSAVTDPVHIEGNCVLRGRTDPYEILFGRDAMDATGRVVLVLASHDYSDNPQYSRDRIVLATRRGTPGEPSCPPRAAIFCPCFNEPRGCGQGCRNSVGGALESGAYLEGTGTSSLASDDLRLYSGGLVPNASTWLFVGSPHASAFGVPFGDGLLCASAPLARVGHWTASPDGTGEWGPGLASAVGAMPGQTLVFQAWYADAAGPCGSGFNVTNGYRVSIAP